MTIVDVSPVEPSVAPPPCRRALLPRNPTPYAPPDAQTLPPQVQRLLQQIGGSTYRTYQPFQVLQPFILPENNPVPTLPLPDTPQTPSSSSTSPVPHPYNPNEPLSRPLSGDFPVYVHTNDTLPGHSPEDTHAPGVTHSPGVDGGGGEDDKGVRGPSPLTHLCRNLLVSHFGLRALRQLLLLIRAPKSVAKFLSTINAKECIVRSPAPLLDVFAEPFFHRAVTWRVVCSLDGQPYLATYAHTDMASLQERRWLTACWGESGDPVGGAWLWCDHPHIMRVWGLVLDDVTGNTFYLLDTPIATLDQIQSRLTLWSVRVPESLIWCVVASLASALRHTLSQSLQYAPLLLSNVFLLHHAIAIENGLTRKKQFTGCSGCSSPHGRPPHHRPASEACMIHHVGQVIFALITCHLRATWTNVDQPHHKGVSYVKMMHVLREEYSGVLLRLLSRTLSGGLARAWAAAGGGQDGIVADRTARWEHTTRGRAKQHCGASLDLDATPLTMLQEPLLPEPLPLPQFRALASVPYSPTRNSSEHLFQKITEGQAHCSSSEETEFDSGELPVISSSPQHSRIHSSVRDPDVRSESMLSHSYLPSTNELYSSGMTNELYSSGMTPTVKDSVLRKYVGNDEVKTETIDGSDIVFESEPFDGDKSTCECDVTQREIRSRKEISVNVGSECDKKNHGHSVSPDKRITRELRHSLDRRNVSSTSDHATRPKSKARDRRHTGDRRPKKHHKSSLSPGSDLRSSVPSKENISPNVSSKKDSKNKESEFRCNAPSKENISPNVNAKMDVKNRDPKLRYGHVYPENPPACLVTDCAPVSLAHIAMLAEEQVIQRCVEGNLPDALRSCPQRLVHLALSQQP